MALAKDPALLILDEPTTGLDATVEAEVLDLVSQLQAELHTSVLFISHNLGVISKMCSRVGVLYAGRLVEEGPVETVLRDPRHPYTVGLLRCIPRGGVRKDHGRLDTIPGFLPSLGADIAGCVFADRCALADERCRAEEPPLISVEGGHESRCWYHERAPRPPARGSRRPRAARASSAAERRSSRSSKLTKIFKQRGHDVHALDGGERCDLAGRDAWPRRRVGEREDDARANAARHRPADCGDGAPRGPRAADPVPEALARGVASAADRVPEPRLGAEPPPLGATDPAALAEEARGRQRLGGRGSDAGPHRARTPDRADAHAEAGRSSRAG